MTFGTSPRLDSLDRKPVRDSARVAPASDSFGGDAALAVTADVQDPAEASGPGQRFAGGSRPETSDAARIRAGTARNAQPSQAAATPEPAAAPSEPAPSAGASLGLFDVDGRDAVPTAISGAGSGSDPRSSRPVRPQAVLVSDPAITLPGRAPGPAPDVEADAARSVERSAGLGAPGSAAHPAPRREPAITLTGRAPGPAPAPAPISDPQLERSAAPDAEIGRDAAGTLPGRAPGPAPAPSATGGMRASEPSAGDVDAAQPPRRARTSPAPHPPPGARPVEPARSAGPPRPVDLDNATTNPPPLRRGPGGQPAMPADPAQLATALADLVSRVADAPFGKPGDSDAAVTQPTLPAVHTGEPQRTSGLADESRNQLVTLRGYGDDASTSRRPVADRAALDDARVTVPRAATAPPDEPARPPDVPAAHEPDAGITEPSLPMLAIGDQRRVDMPLTPPRSEADRTRWAQGLAARIDAALTDEWGNETPIVPPTKAELRALLGQPDPTKQQPIDELELLQRRASELSDPAMPRRAPHPTAEVDPDDIEAAIELAPPARRGTHPHAIGATKPRKPE
ncbi:MAG: hypothetical protein E6J91_17150 [Deltaproteobacteria bacterium]|nr:MAG: hypothetical protein E6J91_17150 [Deltaproteobacteria bacterium]